MVSTSRNLFNSFRRALTLIVAASAIQIVAAGISFAQGNYQELPLSSDAPTLGRLSISAQHSAVVEMLSGAQPLQADPFGKFFNEMLFPLMTQSTTKIAGSKKIDPLINDGGPAKVRSVLKEKYINRATNPAAHKLLNELTLAMMEKIATQNFHPDVRANAVMTIAELNETEPVGPPWKPAQRTLLKLAVANDTIEPVRVAALAGLVRQAQSGIDADLRPDVITAMVALLPLRDPNPKNDRVAADWTCRRAIDVLAALGDLGANAAAVKGLTDTVDDANASLAVRSAAAAAFGKVKFTPPAGFNATNLAKSLGKLAVDSYKTELAASETYRQPIVVERLKRNLNEIKQGLVWVDGKGGVWAMSPAANHQQFVAALAGQIDALAAAATTTKPAVQPKPDPTVPAIGPGTAAVLTPIDTQKPIADAIASAGNNLETILKKGEAAAPAAPAAAAAAAGGAVGGGNAPF